MKKHLARLAQAVCVLASLFALCMNSGAAVRNGSVKLGKLTPGTCIDLTGEWHYKPGYLESADQSGAPPTKPCEQDAGYVPVQVPQFLNRIYWWLDDSEDFKKQEAARLAKLGFDTDRAQDGWYRLVLDDPRLTAGSRLFVEFDGVAMRSETFLNGERVGAHDGMFSRFEYDLTPYLKPGRNVLSVFVSMEKIPPSALSMGTAVTVNLTASKVMTMSKGMFGPLSPNFDNRSYDLHGVWQPVKLVVRGPAQLKDVWFKPSTNSAEIRVEAKTFEGIREARLGAKWFDGKGKLFASVGPVGISLSPEISTHSLQLTGVQPKVWTPAEPNLYRLEVALTTPGGYLLDTWSQKVGFRTFEVRGNKLYLNGKPWWLRGGNHLPYGKNPWDTALAHRLIQSLHDANVRITRTHATPWNEAWLQAADEIGLGVSIEGIRPWGLAGKIGPIPPAMFQHWLMENEDVIRRCRNHPSVLIYTVGNEMMLRDSKNIEKWRQISEVAKQTRQIDPSLPVIISSDYHRDAEFYKNVLKPNGLDDGDMDDAHRYWAWYAESPFVLDSLFGSETKHKDGMRPFIGQEISTGYPDLDSGLPVLRYTRDLVTPQAWVGAYAYPGNDPRYFLTHHRAVTKRMAEQLRFQRGDDTAGFMLFAAECWFRHSFDSKTVSAYPAVDALKEAWAPVGLALETRRRRFYPDEQISTAVFITNDDEQGRDLSDLKLEAVFRPAGSKWSFPEKLELGAIASLPYYKTERVPVELKLPPSKVRRTYQLELRLKSDGKEISRTTDWIEVIPRPAIAKLNSSATVRSLGSGLTGLAKSVFAEVNEQGLGEGERRSVLMLGSKDLGTGLEQGGLLRNQIESGATAVWFSPDRKAFRTLFPNETIDWKEMPGEFADWTPVAGTTLTQDLQPMDLKWWARKNDTRVFVASSSFRLNPKGTVRELIRFIPAHGYISTDKVPEQYRTVLFEIPIGKGRLWICNLDLETSVSVDPAAYRFGLNLLQAATQSDSTINLRPMPTHEELLKGEFGRK